MCGIAGLYNFNNLEQKLKSMLGKLSFRGPDAEGTYIYQNKAYGLGHRRLSIIDLTDAANQPFKKEEWAIVFNGEIYNYKELANELLSYGVKFTTSSDTEVLLEAWKYWGDKCLNKLRGMFAFAIYNEKQDELHLARDPFGIKPLFFYHKNNQLAFASELKSLLHVIETKDINPTAVAASLLYVWLPDSTCIYKDVVKFPAGHYARFKNNKLELKQYYHFDSMFDLAEKSPITEEDLNLVLLDSVRHHVVADVPVATFLSGGLDSSLITAMAKSQVSNLESYTIKFRSNDQKFEAMPDDASFAKKVAEYLNIKLHEIEIQPDITNMLPQIVSSLDEPIGDAAAINTYLICKAARDAGTKVLLSGMGADELFAGYRKHYACMLAAKINKFVPDFAMKLGLNIAERLPVAGNNSGYRYLRWLKRFARFVNLPEEQAFRQSYTYYTQNEIKNLLNEDMHPEVSNVFSEHSSIYWDGPKGCQINRMCYTDIRLFMLGLNLTYTDRASMAASTEVRVPFIDKEVVKASFAIPGRDKLYGNKAKYILKKVAEKWLPKDIIYRPKAGFSAPLRAWVRRDLKELVNDYLLSSSGISSRGIFNHQAIEEMVKDDREGKSDYAQNIWQLLTLEEWFRQHN